MTSGWTPLHACRKAAEVLWRWAVGSLAAATLTLIMLGAAQAVEPNEVLADPALEARARAISAGLRCLVCQNQSIDDSSAPLARDLRLLVRERLSAGDTDEAVRSYLVARYGDFVLLSPPFNTGTLLLWFGPLLLLAAGIVLAGRQLARSTSAAKVVDLATPPPLSPDETKRLEQIMKS